MVSKSTQNHDTSLRAIKLALSLVERRNLWPPLPRLDRAQRVERSLATFILSIWSRCQVHLKIKSPPTISHKRKTRVLLEFSLIYQSSFFLEIYRAPVEPTRVHTIPATDSKPVLGFERLAFVPIFSHWATNMWSSTTVYLSPGW